MDKYLKLLLELDNTIIIPGLGALMVRDDSSKELMFNEYLKFNDGKLDKFITENSSMDEQESKNFVGKYVREIQAKLDVGESYDMFQFGSFAKDKEGKLEFIPWKNDTVPTPTNANNESSNNDNKDLEAEKQAEDLKAKLEAEKIKQTKEKKEREERIAQEKLKNEEAETQKKNVYIPPTSKEDLVAKSSLSADNKDGEEIVSSEAIKENNEKEAKKEKKKRKGILFWILLFLLLILAVGSIAISLNYSKVKDFMGWNNKPTIEKLNVEPKEENETDLEEDLNSNDSILEAEIIDTLANEELINVEAEKENESNYTNQKEEKEEITLEEKNSLPISSGSIEKSNGNYHIVGGSFSSSINAEKLVADLREKSYDAKILGKFGSLTTVVIQSYDTREAAQNALSNIRNDVESAYIMKHPK